MHITSPATSESSRQNSAQCRLVKSYSHGVQHGVQSPRQAAKMARSSRDDTSGTHCAGGAGRSGGEARSGCGRDEAHVQVGENRAVVRSPHAGSAGVGPHLHPICTPQHPSHSGAASPQARTSSALGGPSSPAGPPVVWYALFGPSSPAGPPVVWYALFGPSSPAGPPSPATPQAPAAHLAQHQTGKDQPTGEGGQGRGGWARLRANDL
jgi:hypothetical protein